MDFQSGLRSLQGRGPGSRWLLPALSLSVLLHGLLLLPESRHSQGRNGRVLIAATLRPLAAPAPMATPIPTVAGPPGQALKSRVRDPAGKAVAIPHENTMQAAAAGSAPRADAGTAQGPVTNAPTAAADAASAAGPAGVDADGLRAYRIVLAREAKGQRRYPALARERGWTGTAEIELDVSEQGQVRPPRLIRSSGHELLDREAIALMARAASEAALPAALRGRAFSVRLSVDFQMSPALQD